MKAWLFILSFACGSLLGQVDCPGFSINTQPSDQLVCPGNVATFSVQATGSGALSYQWRKNCVPIPGATDATLMIDPVSEQDFGSYSVVVMDSCGVLVSEEAELGLDFISFGGSSGTRNVCIGATFDFRTVLPDGDFNYQWRKNCVEIPGATSANLVIESFTFDDVGEYDQIISNECTNFTRETFNLNASQAFRLEQQPSSMDACVGDDVVLETGFNLSNPTFDVQWFRDGVAIPGATSLTLALNDIQAADAGSYYLEADTACGVFITENAIVTVEDQPVQITQQPSYCPQPANTTVVLEVQATGPGLMYQWRKDSVPLSGETMATLTIDSLSVADVGSFDCVVTSTCDMVTSDPVSITVAPTPNISQQPVGGTFCLNEAVALSVTLDVGGPFTYQWSLDGQPIAGATAATLDIAAFDQPDAGSYTCEISFCGGSLTSDPAVLVLKGDCIDVVSAFNTHILTANWLDSQGLAQPIDANENGTLTVEEIQQVTGTLDLSGLELADYVGLELFTNLTTLNLSNNGLSDIPNLIALTSLERLILDQNTLGSGTPTGFASLPTNLQALSLLNNELRVLPSLASLTQLSELDASYNRLTSLSQLFTENDIGSDAADDIDVSFNLLAGTDDVSVGNCSAVNDFITRTNTSGATFTFNPQYNFSLYAEWPSITVDVRTLILNGTVNLDCSSM
jgi:hypothetical protein